MGFRLPANLRAHTTDETAPSYSKLKSNILAKAYCNGKTTTQPGGGNGRRASTHSPPHFSSKYRLTFKITCKMPRGFTKACGLMLTVTAEEEDVFDQRQSDDRISETESNYIKGCDPSARRRYCTRASQQGCVLE